MSGGDVAVKLARAWAITRSDGLVLGFTDHDAEISFEGISFRPEAGLSARALVQGAGLSVDNSEAIGALSDAAITEADIAAGRWDGAELQMWEVNWAAPSQRKLVFRGALGEISREGGAFRAELRGLSEPLNQPRGRVFHPRCSAVLGDGACKVNLRAPGLSGEAVISALREDGTVELRDCAAFADRWFERGNVELLDGPAAGLRAQIKDDRARPEGRREVTLWSAPGAQPRVGDRLRLTAGCDKSPEHCRLKFGNFLNFRGFPHLPSEDWLMAPQTEPRPARSLAGLTTLRDLAGG